MSTDDATQPTFAAPVPGDAAPAAEESSAPREKLEGVQATAQSTAEERPELLVLGAFAGGLVLATLLKRLGS